jgi:hypothetical protein
VFSNETIVIDKEVDRSFEQNSHVFNDNLLVLAEKHIIACLLIIASLLRLVLRILAYFYV